MKTLALLLQYTGKYVEYAWVCFKIAIVGLIAFLSGCASSPKHSSIQFTPPSYVKAYSAVSKAQANASSLQSKAPAELKPAVKEIQGNLEDVQKALDEYKANVAKQTDLLNTSIEEKNDALAKAEYWHSKQTKALKELWVWRSIAIVSILSVIGYIGIKTSWRFLL
jgi:hypothetical protein